MTKFEIHPINYFIEMESRKFSRFLAHFKTKCYFCSIKGHMTFYVTSKGIRSSDPASLAPANDGFATPYI